MDMKTLVEATGIKIEALTTWQYRKLIPGHVAKGRGNRGNYDVDTATFVGVMAALSRLGVGPSAAAQIAAECGKSRERYLLVMPEMPAFSGEFASRAGRARWEEARELVRQNPLRVPFDDLNWLDGYFKSMYGPRSPLRPPPAFAVIDVASIRATMQAIEDELERDAPAGDLARKGRAS